MKFTMRTGVLAAATAVGLTLLAVGPASAADSNSGWDPYGTGSGKSADAYYSPLPYSLPANLVHSMYDFNQAGANVCTLGSVPLSTGGNAYAKGVLDKDVAAGLLTKAEAVADLTALNAYAGVVLTACSAGFSSQNSVLAQAYYAGTGASCQYYISKVTMSLDYTTCKAE